MSTNVTWADGVTYSVPAGGEINWPALSAFLIALGNSASITVQLKQAVRKCLTTPVTVSATTDCAIVTQLTSTGAVAVNLPAGVAGRMYFIVDGTGDAGTNNVTINRNGSDTIAGGTSVLLDHNRQGIVLIYNSSDTDWKILAKTTPAGTIVNADIASAAAIAYSKLNLGTSIVNADVSASAAIAYSKLALSSSIATGDLAAALLVPITKGGTGQITATLAENALTPMTATTDGMGFDGTNVVRVDTALLGDFTNTALTLSYTVTNATPAVFTVTSHGLLTGNKVYVTVTQNGFTANTTYWVSKIDANTFKLSSTLANAVAATCLASNASTAGTMKAGGILRNGSSITGVIDGSAATAGYIGQVITSGAVAGTYSATSGQYSDVTSLALTPGSWSLTWQGSFNGGVITSGEIFIGTVSGNDATGRSYGNNDMYIPIVAAANLTSAGVNQYLVDISAAATYYGKVNLTYTGSPSYNTRMSALRIR